MIKLNYQQAKDFLAQNKITNCEIKQVAGDASFRSYYRVFEKDKSHILMFAPPSHEDIKPFEKIDNFLVKNEFSAPRISARSEKDGFLLLEDLGDDTYGRVLTKDVSGELELYKSAIDVLLELHKLEVPKDLPVYNHALLFREVMLLVDWYAKLKGQVISKQEIADFKFLWFKIFDKISKENQILVLRDYHADNLMILPNRVGFKAVGLLDFQDAVIGSKAYDVVSLLEDARRDVDIKNRDKLLKYYLEKSAIDEKAFLQDYAILSLQRNIKIVGIFARLSIRDGKNSYLNLIPRVLGFIENRLNVNDDLFSDLKILLKKFL